MGEGMVPNWWLEDVFGSEVRYAEPQRRRRPEQMIHPRAERYLDTIKWS